jgi:hypothetical protein
MKKGILFLLLSYSVTVNAQSLKDLLYGGKLKSDTGTLVKKTDDLSTKIDTIKKKPVEPEKTKLAAAVKDSSVKTAAVQTDLVATTTTAEGKDVAVEVKDNNAITKDNNKLWKEYMDSMAITFKDEVLTSKKIKDGTYTILVDYEIGPDGQVTIKEIYPSPDNSTLAKEIKERLILTVPNLTPVMGTNGKPRKVVKKYNFTLTKA